MSASRVCIEGVEGVFVGAFCARVCGRACSSGFPFIETEGARGAQRDRVKTAHVEVVFIGQRLFSQCGRD